MFNTDTSRNMCSDCFPWIRMVNLSEIHMSIILLKDHTGNLCDMVTLVVQPPGRRDHLIPRTIQSCMLHAYSMF